MLSFSSKKRLPLAAALGCSCRRTTLGSLFSFRLRRPSRRRLPTSAASDTNTAVAAAADLSGTSLLSHPPPPQRPPARPPSLLRSPRPRPESVPVVKVSHQPLQDFRESMLQMILEEEIFAWEDLRELLRCFLVLNSPHHHDAILIAFSDICTGVFSAAATATA
ncbi:unnamed protein product [Spirodela intermedia]|uniref:Transcription repressor n=1 Tax=Spirodela intermedia TaxID=51605 RepID=A0A7I8JG48_SPIIN|nr:unnamed protein product [Spirodela intermedia]CAA6668473.1 unnamed protein product [Spirodela intermedia]